MRPFVTMTIAATAGAAVIGSALLVSPARGAFAAGRPASTATTCAGPGGRSWQPCATPGISLLRLDGHDCIAAALRRHHAANPARPIDIVLTS